MEKKETFKWLLKTTTTEKSTQKLLNLLKRKTTRTAKPKRKEVDLSQSVLVINMTQGSLTYVAKKVQVI